MRILMVHANYAQRGGEDVVCEAERALLLKHGHYVSQYRQDNTSIRKANALSTGIRTLWSQQDYKDLRDRIRQERIDLVAVHNFFPLISPSVFYAASAEKVPVVQTLHNYRLICPAATLFRDGAICEECVGKPIALPSIRHACYRSSSILSAGVTAMSGLHRALGTWDRHVTRYIAPTTFVRDRYLAGGFPAAKIMVKPNFTEDTGIGNGGGGAFVYVGRLSPEKGIDVLLRAWEKAKPGCELRILGAGPEELNLKAQAARMPGVRFLGAQPKERVQAEVGAAIAVVVPSIWEEPFGLTTIEALAKGTPVLASDVGGIPSLITPGRSGYLFPLGDSAHLARLLLDQGSLRAMRSGARREFEQRYTGERNYEMLMEIYESAIQTRG